MKTLSILAAIALLATPALAQEDRGGTWQPGAKTTGTPTGYQIRGCAHYNLDGTRIKQVCDLRSTRNPEFWRNHERHIGGGVQETK